MKKTLALALTAAMAISAVSTTAFAASVDVKKDVEPWERKATAKITDEDLGQATNAEVKNLPTLDSDDVYKFLGWTTDSSKASETAYHTTSDTPVLKKYNEIFYDNTGVQGEAATVASNAKDQTQEIYPVFRRWANQKELDKWKEVNGKNADDEAKKKAFEDKLAAADETHNATVNDNTGEEIKTNKVETTDARKWKKDATPENVVPEFYHDGKVAELGDNDVAFYYEGKGFKDDKDGKLVSGKNTRVEMTLPDKYTTDGMNVTVYKIDGWCTSTKIKKANMMVNGNKIAIWDNTTKGRYIAVLSPKGASAGTDGSNPSTGDFSALPIAMLAVAALGATGFVAYKKRMAE